MMPFIYPSRPTAYLVSVIANQTHDEDEADDDEEEEEEEEDDDDYSPPATTVFSRTMPMSMTALSRFVNLDGHIPPPPPTTSSLRTDEQGTYRLRMNVDGFRAHELNVAIRHGRLIVRGKHIVRAQTQLLSTNPLVNENEDTEPDFVSKEFKRTFIIPSNTDVRKANAQFYPQQQILMIEIPFQNLAISSQRIIIRSRIRPIDIFLTIITILLMDRALRITYEQFTLSGDHSANTSSRRRRENRDLFSSS